MITCVKSFNLTIFLSFFFFFLLQIAHKNNTVTLSKTKKKGREAKESLVNSIKKGLDDYKSAYVFTVQNMRNQNFKNFRDQLKHSSRYPFPFVSIYNFPDTPIKLFCSKFSPSIIYFEAIGYNVLFCLV
jgi:Ribosomal protein L10